MTGHIARLAKGSVAVGALTAAIWANPADAQLSPANPAASNTEQVVVTAEKREERLQDVPVPVTAIEASTLLSQNQMKLEEYYNSIPSLNLSTGDFRGDPILTIRGITTGGGGLVNPTVGVVIDDIPYGSSTGKGGGGPVVDLDPSILQRIEVLRGPQGTLYGVSSIGGLLKYVTANPSTDSFSGRVSAGLSTVENSGQVGYVTQGAVNVPITDNLAVIASGSFRRDPGYVDNVLTGQHDVNSSNVADGYFAGLWNINNDWSLKLSALLQSIQTNGSANIDPALGDFKQSAVGHTGWYDKRTQAYGAVIKGRVGDVDLTSLTGYSVNSVKDAVDYSNVLGAFSVGLFGVPTFVFTDTIKTEKFSEELRASGSVGSSLDWLAGAFYTNENTSYFETDYAANPITGANVGYWLTEDSFPTTYQEVAVFADLTVHFSERFDLQVGGRWSHNGQHYMETFIGPAAFYFFGGSLTAPLIQPFTQTSDSSLTYLFTPEYKFSDDLMVYARAASGYRAGGPNANTSFFTPPLPTSFRPDTTDNYEIGAKGNLFGGMLTFDASLFYINWKDIQLQLTAPVTGANYYANGSRAVSQGVELSATARPTDDLRITGWISYDDAALAKPIPPGGAGSPVANVGDRLPGGSPFSSNLSADWFFDVMDNWTGSLGGSFSYTGDRKGIFVAAPPRQDYPAYTDVDLRASLDRGNLGLNFFVTNLLDTHGVLAGGIGSVNPIHFHYTQPRTIGVTASWKF